MLRVNIQRSGFPFRHHCQGYNLSRDSTTVVIRTPRLTSLLLWVTKCALYVTEGSTVSRLYNTEVRFRHKKFPSAVLIDRYKTGLFFLILDVNLLSYIYVVTLLWLFRLSCSNVDRTDFNNILIKFKKSPISNLKEIRPVESALIYTGRRTDGHDEANSIVSRLCERT